MSFFILSDKRLTISHPVLSTHEKRQKDLAEEIAQLESEAVGPKEWTLLGEASSRTRPQNSLLEEDLDFEHVAKVVPVITEDSVATMEELIKQRILDVSLSFVGGSCFGKYTYAYPIIEQL